MEAMNSLLDVDDGDDEMTDRPILRETLNGHQARVISESKEVNGEKNWYLSGVFIQGDVKNHNERVYPKDEISYAVNAMQQKISDGIPILGEADHPENLNINLDKVSHMIESISMDGSNGIGKLKILPTPMGTICQQLLEAGVKLGVSSRGSGLVDGGGYVSDFDIVTIDIVATPSAPDAYPDPIFENLINRGRGRTIMDAARRSSRGDIKARDAVAAEIIEFIRECGLRRD